MSLFSRLVALWALLLCAQAFALPAPEEGKLTVYFLDVGQGDAALVVSPAGKTVLVDGGPPGGGPALSARLSRLLGAPLDLVILSHPHLDHLGGLPHVLDSPGAKRFMDPGFDHSTSAYRDLLRKVGEKDVPLLEPLLAEDGSAFTLDVGGGASLTVLWPRRPKEPFLQGTRSDANSNSIVFRLDFGKTAFLFAGDAEAATEAQLLRSRQRLSATVLKVPHHGSRHSSQAAFLARVAPSAVVISCGRDNEYRHPHPDALGRYRQAGAEVFRTDLQGDILAVSDGQKVVLTPLGRSAPVPSAGSLVPQAKPGAATAGPPAELGEAGSGSPAEPAAASSRPPAESPASGRGGYAASARSKVFHRSDCPTVKRIKDHNLVRFADRSQAASERKPSKDCSP